ncbi:uncharacterized protein LOC141900401 [Tubulanus polymorphus]|uniref:uncharacterized protein LOC141900401 n=1 Tax=Tubulanus polymorphus TaxID=672921 RepID=UPI003DA50D37
MADIYVKNMKIGEVVLRYINVNVINEECFMSNDGIPLFLGADIFQGGPVAQKHQSRVNQSFCKRGEATRIDFKNVQVAGIKNALTPLWFYSVSGLFSLVFERHTKEMKKLCLVHLKDLWLQFCDDAPLPHYMQMRFHSQVYEYYNDTRTGEYQADCTASQSNPHTDHQNFVITEFPVFDVCGEINNFRTLCQVLISSDNSHTTPTCNFCIFSLINNLLEKYLKIINDLSCDSCRVTEYDTCDYMLCTIADWLGKKFAGLKQNVEKAVDTFKVNHIDCIDNLPPPEDIVSELFPKCMQILICQWMDVQNYDSNAENNSDHVSKKRRVSDGRNEDVNKRYHFVQLVLEFCNSAFVSGMSHVINAKLLHS